MFVHSGGGGKGIRPNQHNQQQQQQGQQHHQSHHPTHHQTPHQQHQQQQVQLQTGSIQHSHQTSAQTAGNSHPHQHQQQTAAPPPHQQTFPQHLAFYPYPIHVQAPSTSGQHHPGQNTSSNVGGAQLAPSPPTHTGGNGAQGGSGGAGGGGGAGSNNATGNVNSNAGTGGGRGQGQGTSNPIPHFAQGTIIQTNLQAPTSNPFLTQQYQLHLPQHNTPSLMMYNTAAAAGQHGNPSGGQTGPIYPAQAQTSAAHHGAQQAMHYYTNQAVPAPTPTPLHQPHQHMRNVFISQTRPQHMIYLQQTMPAARPALITNAHQQQTGASGTSAVHVAAPIQNTTTRGASAGPTSYVQPPYCTHPLQMGGPASLTSQPPPILTAAGIGAQQLPNSYGHLAASTASSTPIQMPTSSGSVGPASSSSGMEHTGMKPRRHAIPIINPVTMETVTFEPQSKSTSSAVEIKAPSEADNKPAKTTTVTLTAPPPEPANPATSSITTSASKDNDKSITASVEDAPQSSGVSHVEVEGGVGAKDKIDQQMQTEVYVKAEASAKASTEIPQPQSVAGSVQTRLEENDDTDADTPELEHDDEAKTQTQLEQTPSNVCENLVQESQLIVDSSETDPTTETDGNYNSLLLLPLLVSYQFMYTPNPSRI